MTTMPSSLDLVLYYGATFEETFTWKDADGNPIDLTGFTAVLKCRERNVSGSTAILEMTSESGQIILGGTNGTIKLLLSATYTASLHSCKPKRGVYGIKLTDGSGKVHYFMEGTLEFKRMQVW